MFSREFCETSKNTFLQRTPLVAASEITLILPFLPTNLISNVLRQSGQVFHVNAIFTVVKNLLQNQIRLCRISYVFAIRIRTTLQC